MNPNHINVMKTNQFFQALNFHLIEEILSATTYAKGKLANAFLL